MTVFSAMGTEVRVEAPPGAPIDDVERIFARLERRFSRFREDSELSALDRAREPLVVSRSMCDALARARRYTELTGGLFDPAVGGALLAHGYDRSFAPGALDRDTPASQSIRSSVCELDIDELTRTVHRPAHLHLDLGGMIKGHAVDLAAARLGPGALVDAGGDAVLSGEPAPGLPWIVDVEDPRDPRAVLLSVAVHDRAVATSAANRRAWRRAGSRAHHLIDPRAWAPAQSDLVQVTVLAASAELAEVLAKAIFVGGSAHAERLLDRVPDTAAVLVRDGGALGLVGELEVVDA